MVRGAGVMVAGGMLLPCWVVECFGDGDADGDFALKCAERDFKDERSFEAVGGALAVGRSNDGLARPSSLPGRMGAGPVARSPEEPRFSCSILDT